MGKQVHNVIFSTILVKTDWYSGKAIDIPFFSGRLRILTKTLLRSVRETYVCVCLVPPAYAVNILTMPAILIDCIHIE